MSVPKRFLKENEVHLSISICNKVIKEIKGNGIRLGTVVENIKTHKQYYVLGFDKDNYFNIFVVLENVENMKDTINVIVDKLSDKYKKVNQMRVDNSYIRRNLPQQSLTHYLYIMKIVDLIEKIDVGTLLRVYDGLWYSLILDKKEDSYIYCKLLNPMEDWNKIEEIGELIVSEGSNVIKQWKYIDEYTYVTIEKQYSKESITKLLLKLKLVGVDIYECLTK